MSSYKVDAIDQHLHRNARAAKDYHDLRMSLKASEQVINAKSHWSQTSIRGGRYIPQSEIDVIARARVQTTLDE